VDVAIEGGHGAVDVEVTNSGRFPPEFGVESELEAERGRGVPLMLALVDEVEFAPVRGRTRVRLRRVSS
jgi:anti-sigma regulatory factor (Ser/Thr protein kinase)